MRKRELKKRIEALESRLALLEDKPAPHLCRECGALFVLDPGPSAGRKVQWTAHVPNSGTTVTYWFTQELCKRCEADAARAKSA